MKKEKNPKKLKIEDFRYLINACAIKKDCIVIEKILQLLKSVREDVDFEKKERLMDDGILDSFDVVAIVGELCDAYDVTITVEDLEAENFNSAAAILKLVERLQDEF